MVAKKKAKKTKATSKKTAKKTVKSEKSINKKAQAAPPGPKKRTKVGKFVARFILIAVLLTIVYVILGRFVGVIGGLGLQNAIIVILVISFILGLFTYKRKGVAGQPTRGGKFLKRIIGLIILGAILYGGYILFGTNLQAFIPPIVSFLTNNLGLIIIGVILFFACIIGKHYFPQHHNILTTGKWLAVAMVVFTLVSPIPVIGNFFGTLGLIAALIYGMVLSLIALNMSVKEFLIALKDVTKGRAVEKPEQPQIDRKDFPKGEKGEEQFIGFKNAAAAKYSEGMKEFTTTQESLIGFEVKLAGKFVISFLALVLFYVMINFTQMLTQSSGIGFLSGLAGFIGGITTFSITGLIYIVIAGLIIWFIWKFLGKTKLFELLSIGILGLIIIFGVLSSAFLGISFIKIGIVIILAIIVIVAMIITSKRKQAAAAGGGGGTGTPPAATPPRPGFLARLAHGRRVRAAQQQAAAGGNIVMPTNMGGGGGTQ